MFKTYYDYYQSPIGLLEIITDKDYLLSIMFVEEKVAEDLFKENISTRTSSIKNCEKKAERPAILSKVINQLDEYFKGFRKDFDIKYKFIGTEFQKKVWSALADIPYGETVSYKYIATKIGNEKASRAVGNANNKNVLTIVIPCHRVIGADKSLTGYAGGLDKKQWLLEHENTK